MAVMELFLSHNNVLILQAVLFNVIWLMDAFGQMDGVEELPIIGHIHKQILKPVPNYLWKHVILDLDARLYVTELLNSHVCNKPMCPLAAFIQDALGMNQTQLVWEILQFNLIAQESVLMCARNFLDVL